MTAVSLEHVCGSVDCGALAEKTYALLTSGGYERGVSLMQLPETVDGYLADHRTTRKRHLRAQRLGYRAAVIDRSQFVDDIHAINVSMPVRQGRPMSSGYLERQEFSRLPEYSCLRHGILVYGILDEAGTLVAYLVAHRVGELVMVSQILGHGDHLANEVMYLLFVAMVADQVHAGPGFVFYNRHDSGTDGLRFFKERLGLAATDVEWCL